MNEQLFIDAAKMRADGRVQRRPTRGSRDCDGESRWRHVIAFAAALLINLAVLGTLQLSAAKARHTPAGEVVITQLDSAAQFQLAKN